MRKTRVNALLLEINCKSTSRIPNDFFYDNCSYFAVQNDEIRFEAKLTTPFEHVWYCP